MPQKGLNEYGGLGSNHKPFYERKPASANFSCRLSIKMVGFSPRHLENVLLRLSTHKSYAKWPKSVEVGGHVY